MKTVSDPDDLSIHRQSKIFCEIGAILTSSLNPGEVFNRVMRLIGRYFAPRNWSLLLMEEKTGRLTFEIVMGVDTSRLKNVYIEKNEGIAGWVCQNCQPAIVENVRKDPRFSPRVDDLLGFKTSSIVCVPLLNGSKRVIGALEMINQIAPAPESAGPESPPVYSDQSDKPFTVLDMEILSAIGVFTGIATENAFLHQKIKHLAMIDPLTGIYNRHYFNEVLKREQQRVKRKYYTICILMMDIDGLKNINDHYGHLMGDKVICDIATILKSAIRESDVLARFGGDEFVILIPSAGAGDGKNLADRIQREIEKRNTALALQHQEPVLGLSIGVYASDSDDPSTDLAKMIQQADRELYLTKYLQQKHETDFNADQLKKYLNTSLLSKD